MWWGCLIKKGLLLSVRVKKIKSVNNWQSYKQERGCLVHFARLANTLLKAKKVHETITFLLVTLSNIHQFYHFFTHRLNDKHFFICLLTTQPHLKHAATLPCNLSLNACFADINVSQGSVATCARCGGFLISIQLQIYRGIFR